MFFKKLLHYLNFTNFNDKTKGNINLKLMHGINRISIFMFIICLLVMLFRYVF